MSKCPQGTELAGSGTLEYLQQARTRKKTVCMLHDLHACTGQATHRRSQSFCLRSSDLMKPIQMGSIFLATKKNEQSRHEVLAASTDHSGCFLYAFVFPGCRGKRPPTPTIFSIYVTELRYEKMSAPPKSTLIKISILRKQMQAIYPGMLSTATFRTHQSFSVLFRPRTRTPKPGITPTTRCATHYVARKCCYLRAENASFFEPQDQPQPVI